MDTYWVPRVNHLGSHGRGSFAEVTNLYWMQEGLGGKVQTEFAKMIEAVVGK
ncbi:hypothetical protein [Accumulibacter sp.]|uniref:hypothetical protein n=1 Tax=Accumulibacter sp. TaxID=2053492 RepID=UPI0028C45C31|nr:hypothetical protein [Accumulibacter sp.]